jgi:hypothetical protein
LAGVAADVTNGDGKGLEEVRAVEAPRRRTIQVRLPPEFCSLWLKSEKELALQLPTVLLS